MNKSFILDSPFFLFFKEHLCPYCGRVITVKKVRKIVNKKSPDAKDFDFSFGDSYFWGDVEFFYHLLYCDSCNNSYSIDEIKNYEKHLKKVAKSQQIEKPKCQLIRKPMKKTKKQISPEPEVSTN